MRHLVCRRNPLHPPLRITPFQRRQPGNHNPQSAAREIQLQAQNLEIDLRRGEGPDHLNADLPT